MSEPVIEAGMPLSVYVDDVVMLLGAGKAPGGVLVHHQDALSGQTDHPCVAPSAGVNDRHSLVVFCRLLVPVAEG